MAMTEESASDEVGNSPDEIEWTPENEVHLFYAMRGHKPVGVGKYFQMACIVEKFRNFANRDVTSKPLWEHLETLYDIQSLDDIESMPFPNEETDFFLPEEEFGNLIQERTKGDKVKADNSDEDSKKEPISVSSKMVKEINVKKDDVVKEVKNSPARKEAKESKDIVKEVKKESKDSVKDAKKSVNKETKETKKESKEGKKDSAEAKESKTLKQRGGTKERREEEKEEEVTSSPVRKDRGRETTDPKRGAKRSSRGGNKSDDTSSNQSNSPVTTPTPPPPPLPPPPTPPQKRRRL